jgi:hypothetical protein
MDSMQLAKDVRQAYAVLAEADEKEAARLAAIERSKRVAAREGLLTGVGVMPKCRCLNCITSILLMEKPNPRKCESQRQDPEPRRIRDDDPDFTV